MSEEINMGGLKSTGNRNTYRLARSSLVQNIPGAETMSLENVFVSTGKGEVSMICQIRNGISVQSNRFVGHCKTIIGQGIPTGQ